MDFKVKFPQFSYSLCQIPRLGNLLWVLELSKQCKNFFGIIVLQFVGQLLSGSMVGLMVTSSKKSYAHTTTPRSAATRAPVPVADHHWPMPLQETLTQNQVWLSLCEVSWSWCAWGFVWAFQGSLVGMEFNSKCDFALPTILLGLLLYSWYQDALGIFSSGIQLSPVDGCSAVSCSFGVLAEENDHTPFYSTILDVLLHCQTCKYQTVW